MSEHVIRLEYVIRVAVEESAVDDRTAQGKMVSAVVASALAVNTGLEQAGIRNEVTVTTAGGRQLARYGASPPQAGGDPS